MSKHTPWKLNFNKEADNSGISINDLVDRDGDLIATRVSPYHENILLAAPEMLEALKAITKELEAPTTRLLNSNRRGDQSLGYTLRWVCGLCTKAIAKAEGSVPNE